MSRMLVESHRFIVLILEWQISQIYIMSQEYQEWAEFLMYLNIDLLPLVVLEHPFATDAWVLGLSLLVFIFVHLLLITKYLTQVRVSPALIALNALLLGLKGFYWWYLGLWVGTPSLGTGRAPSLGRVNRATLGSPLVLRGLATSLAVPLISGLLQTLFGGFFSCIFFQTIEDLNFAPTGFIKLAVLVET